MAIPDREQAEAILRSYWLPDGVVRHVEGVRDVATAAAGLVAAAGIPVDVELVTAAALLHDIDKVETRGKDTHGLVAAARMVDLGYEELAVPIASHPVTALLDEELFPRGWPSVVVSVADRHVTQEFVTTDQRIDDLEARYPQYRESLEVARPRALALEAELAEAAGLNVEDLVAELRAAWQAGRRT